jgi:hypothetical protein
MKTSKFILTLLLAGGIASNQAQESVANIFKSGKDDLNTIANGYLKPFGNGFATGLGSNWYNTADVHSVLGFDLTIGANAVFAPKEDQTFSLTDLKNLKADNNELTAPTFAGKGNGVNLSLYQNGTKIVSFTTPKGVSQVLPTPTVQFTIGVPVVNDVSVRFIPTLKSGDTELSMWGVGVKHNFKRWIPGVKLLPFDAAAIVSYTHFNVQYSLPTTVTPDMLVNNSTATVDYNGDATAYAGQNMHLSANALMGNIIVSKKLLFVTPYAGFGITKTNFDVTMAGTYPILTTVKSSNGSSVVMNYEDQVDPVKVTDSQTMANLTLGLRLKLALLTFHGQYVFQKYPTASVGLGVSFR